VLPQIVTYAVVEKKWRKKVSFGRTMMQAWSYYGWQKGPPWDEATLNSGKIKPVALAIL